MKRGLLLFAVATGCLMTPVGAHAQAAPAQNSPQDSKQNAPATAPKQESNPFPDDTTSVPVMPSKDTPGTASDSAGGDAAGSDARQLALPGDDHDPVRSPDDAADDSGSAQEAETSSSRSGMDRLLPDADDNDQPGGRKRKLAAPGPEHKETSAEDIEVGKYYLEKKNWRAALSRFESAMVLAPDEPEVYWGLAESARHLGNFVQARGYYQKVAEYDPDSRHGKDAIKALKDPEIANAKALPPAAAPVATPAQ